MNKNLYIFAIVILLLFSSCDSRRVFEKYQPIPHSGWHKDSIQFFDVNINDTLQYNNILIDVRHDVNYAYSNLWLFVSMEDPQNKIIIDTLEIQLAKTDGKWLGSGVSATKLLQAPFKQNIYFPQAGNYRFGIQQGMRHDILKGIESIGIRVEKTQ